MGRYFISFLLLFICFDSTVFSQNKIAISDGHHLIELKKGYKIAYLTKQDTLRLSDFHKTTEIETVRYGRVFKKEQITGFDSTSILCIRKNIEYDSLRYIYHDRKYLGYKISGVGIALASLAILISAVDVRRNHLEDAENKRTFIGIGGILLGGFLTFKNYNPLLKWDSPYSVTIKGK
jgi:hypothetical protein